MSKNYHLSCLIKRNGSWFELGAFIFTTNAIQHAAKDQIDRQRVCTINVWVALMSGIIVWVALSPLVMRPVPVVFSPHTLPSSSISLFTVVFFWGQFDGPLRPFSAHPLLCRLSSVSCWWRVHEHIVPVWLSLDSWGLDIPLHRCQTNVRTAKMVLLSVSLSNSTLELNTRFQSLEGWNGSKSSKKGGLILLQPLSKWMLSYLFFKSTVCFVCVYLFVYAFVCACDIFSSHVFFWSKNCVKFLFVELVICLSSAFSEEIYVSQIQQIFSLNLTTSRIFLIVGNFSSEKEGVRLMNPHIQTMQVKHKFKYKPCRLEKKIQIMQVKEKKK